jgi:4-amino-4-deoxy-L-arabinose transferase-like glycosyltransferase
MRRFWRGPATDPAWARPAFFGLLGLTALLFLVNLTRNGWANDFYSAAVQAGTKSWKAFFFGSFDSSNFITVDKTPASLWVMELSGRVFGFSQWSMLAPQALEGVASVGLLYAAVKRWFGPAAGLIAGAVLALTPVAALMFRFNNPDALLVLLLTAAAYALVRALESGHSRWLVLCGVLLGFGFLAKMLQAFLVVPGFAAAYLWAGPPRLGRRLWQLLLAGLGIIVGAGWWVLAAPRGSATAATADRPGLVPGQPAETVVAEGELEDVVVRRPAEVRPVRGRR